MSIIVDKKTLEVFTDVIIKIVTEAVDDISGVKLVPNRKAKNAVTVDFLEGDRVDVELYISIDLGLIIPDIVVIVQERVISEIEKVTKYRVHNLNVQIANIESDN